MKAGKTGQVVLSSCLVAFSLPFLVSGLSQYRASILWMRAQELDCENAAAMELASQLYEDAYPYFDWNSWFLTDYGRCLEGAGRLKGAIRVFEQASRQRPDPYALEELAGLYARRGSLERAIQAAERASFMLPWRLTSKWQLAYYHSEVGNHAQARAYARDLLLTPMKAISTRGVRLKTKARRLLAGEPALEPSEPSDQAAALDLVDLQWRPRVTRAFEIAGRNAAELSHALQTVDEAHRGDLVFLIVHMPEFDLATLTAKFLLKDLDSALQSRDLFPFLEEVPDDIFRNYVLPYAQMDEHREDWRSSLRGMFAGSVQDAGSVEEVVLALKDDLFSRFGVSYEDRPVRSVQSPAQSSQIGQVDCVGGSILFADTLRSLGIPSRIVVIPHWIDNVAGHAWNEVYVEGHWRSIGLADDSRFDESWFHEKASETDPSQAATRLYATTFARTGQHLEQWGADVWWHDITDRYVPDDPGLPGKKESPGNRPGDGEK